MHVGEDGRLHEQTVAQDAVPGRAAAGDQLGALILGRVDEGQNAVELGFIGRRAHFGGQVQRVAQLDLAGAGGQGFDDLGIDRPLHQQARAGDAGLAGGGEDARQGADRGLGNIGVVEDDIGRLAAQLEDHRGEVLPGGGGDLTPRAPAAGEADLAQAAASHQGLADAQVAGDDVEHALGEARFLDQLGEFQGGGRGVL